MTARTTRTETTRTRGSPRPATPLKTPAPSSPRVSERTGFALLGALALGLALAAPPVAAVSAAEKPDRPATAPAPGRDGTAPGNEGSTGWTGGTGGAYIGTSPHAPAPGSPTAQPETAEGVAPGPGGGSGTATGTGTGPGRGSSDSAR